MGRYSEKVNTSRNQRKIKTVLENLGHTNVEVWWEPLGSANEMCGPDGGFFFCSDEMEIESLGYTFIEAIKHLQDISSFDLRPVG